jgi:heme/copper-type cytochrome/quinol oxidase subunit 4
VTPEERRGWTRVAASITAYLAIGVLIAGGLWWMIVGAVGIWSMWQGSILA